MAKSPPPTTTQPPAPPHPTSSPTSTHRKPSTTSTSTSTLPTSTETIPLCDPSRTTPLHALLPTILVPPNTSTTNLNPLTLQPFTDAELKSYQFDKLVSEHLTSAKAEVERARDDAVKALKERIEEREAKVREIEKEIEEKEKIREVERKVYRKQMEGRKE